jgi:hypothetical protein
MVDGPVKKKLIKLIKSLKKDSIGWMSVPIEGALGHVNGCKGKYSGWSARLQHLTRSTLQSII